MKLIACDFGHDHQLGDEADCNAAYAAELARAHARGWHGDGLPKGRCPSCDAGTPASNARVLPSDRAERAFRASVTPCMNCGQSLREHDATTHGCMIDRPEPRGPMVTVTAVELRATPDYDRLTLSCGHVYEAEEDGDNNASLVGAETNCEACDDAARGR